MGGECGSSTIADRRGRVVGAQSKAARLPTSTSRPSAGCGMVGRRPVPSMRHGSEALRRPCQQRRAWYRGAVPHAGRVRSVPQRAMGARPTPWD
jgi:hypothetical protein